MVDDEIKRSVEALRGISEIQRYFLEEPLAQSIASFLPLNLPLYSFVIFGAIPAYQSVSLTIRTPERMCEVFDELANVLSLKERYPNIHLFEGSRERFVSEHCKKASVVIFTGRRENFTRIQKACGTDTLLLYNGVGHNPLVITPSADMDLAVQKTLYVKLFNNGQDCAGPDNILVHSLVVEIYMEKLLAELSKVKCSASYADDDVAVGPLFEISSLQHVVEMISNMRRQEAYIKYGGQVDLLHNIVYPCVVRTTLKQLQNFREMYAPIFLVTEYEHDRELALYFDDPSSQYQNSEMYISLFGESDYVASVKGSIILKNCTIHDVEKGLYEFGGYSPGASQVSYHGVQISKPLLVPREIRNFIGTEGKKIFAGFPGIKDDFERQIVAAQFQENV
ncbi:MAG: aldehyde dehydrogenase [Candidatus Staskawiczbacteria bacterium]|nr:aldehyde dehydrogenase [Candidatus Staskawiczbacteria bacterium]